MKWVLVVMIFNTAPVKTNAVFDTLDDCLKAEEQMRAEYARVYNSWRQWAVKNNSADREHVNFHQKRMGLHNAATCIPHS